jgi:hypothetical protein
MVNSLSRVRPACAYNPLTKGQDGFLINLEYHGQHNGAYYEAGS